MNGIAVIIGLLLLFMAVPDACRRLGRPALVFPAFVLFGAGLGFVIDDEVTTMLEQAGHIGFLLLLFEVGLEIDLPRLREFLPPLRHAFIWAGIQYPVAGLAAWHAGLNPAQSFLAAAALTGCSVSMAHAAWKSYPLGPASARRFVLHVMVGLEMLAIVVMAVGTTALKEGFSPWILARLAGIGVAVFVLARYAAHLARMFQHVIDHTTHWRLHWLALLVLAICAVGQRLGLDAAKTAFVLGLCLSRARHHGMNLEAHLAPLSQRFLIPIFFVSLGLSLEWKNLTVTAVGLAIGTAGLLLGIREVLHRRWLPTGGSGPAFLLLSPNLTMVALAANALITHGQAHGAAAWLILTGLCITVPAIALLPAPAQTTSAAAAPPPTAP